jgi:pimeloyl-ACP methyl ester carboxylesterase
MATYVLIHGAWYGGWCWATLAKELESRGHRCFAPDLPGHGQDRTLASTITFESYVDSLRPYLAVAAEPVILVGHSFGAMIAQSLAEQTPGRTKCLVFVAGNVAPSGSSLIDIVVGDPESRLGPDARESDGIVSRIRKESAIPALFNRCTTEVAYWAAAQLGAEPIGPWSHQIECRSAAYSEIPKYYIECTDDRAVTPKQQRAIRQAAPCDFLTLLEADHSPFLSQPIDLAVRLHSLSQPTGDSVNLWKNG